MSFRYLLVSKKNNELFPLWTTIQTPYNFNNFKFRLRFSSAFNHCPEHHELQFCSKTSLKNNFQTLQLLILRQSSAIHFSNFFHFTQIASQASENCVRRYVCFHHCFQFIFVHVWSTSRFIFKILISKAEFLKPLIDGIFFES